MKHLFASYVRAEGNERKQDEVAVIDFSGTGDDCHGVIVFESGRLKSVPIWTLTIRDRPHD